MNEQPVILWRHHDPLDTTEYDAANKYFKVFTQRTDIPKDSLVIGRYSVLPFYKELEKDLSNNGSKLINSYQEHRYVADLQNWYQDLKDFTPETWFRLEDVPDSGPFVVKGETNSKKFQWNRMMYAETKRDVCIIAGDLMQDSLISSQNIYVRKYVPLRRLTTGLNGLPISEEYRFFILNGKILTGAFYWSSHVNDIKSVPKPFYEIDLGWLLNVINKVKNNIPFFVIDVARTEDNNWIVIELNDAQMSGLSENKTDILYKGMRFTLKCP